jgi:hypothetical protein
MPSANDITSRPPCIPTDADASRSWQPAESGSATNERLGRKPIYPDGPTRTAANRSEITVRWTAVDDKQRYRRLLLLIFRRAEEALAQAHGQGHSNDAHRAALPHETARGSRR